MPRIAIVGMPKSGTSALYAAIKRSGRFVCLHEPSRPDQLKYLVERPERDKLMKVLTHTLVGHLDADLSGFDRIVQIVRDPRDMWVSWLLYRPFMRQNWKNEAFMEELLSALERKERDPRSVTVHELYEVLDRHEIVYTTTDAFQRMFRMDDRLLRQHPHALRISYEQFVDGEIGELRDYLGLEVDHRAELAPGLRYNERSKAYGNWRQWFTPEDVERYRPAFHERIVALGYDTTWELAEEPVVRPEQSSGYLRRNVARFEVIPPAFGRLRARAEYTNEYLRALDVGIEDGDEGAIVEMALAHLFGYGVRRDPRRTIELLRDAAARGNHLAHVHLMLAYEHGVGVPRDAEGVRRHETAARSIRNRRRTDAARAGVEPLWRRAKAEGSLAGRLRALGRRLPAPLRARLRRAERSLRRVAGRAGGNR